MFDVIIIGAGPAGLSAAIYAARAGLDCMILESAMYGGQMTTTPEVENYPCVKKISGWELSQNMYEQATDLGAVLNFENVERIEDNSAFKTVVTADNKYEAKTVIIANGAKRRKLGCDGEERLSGLGVSYCAFCDGSFFKGKTAVVVGGGNTALEDALYLSNICSKVYLVHRRDEFRAEKHLVNSVNSRENIVKLMSYVPVRIDGESKVESIVLKNATTQAEETFATDCVFVAIGLSPDNGIFEGVIDLDANGYIIAGEDCRTSAEGIFAAGDTRTKTIRQIVTAASDGAVAASGCSAYINSL
ncbi:MAG: thioredoxin-disulfide reductase [Clostridia bacterium]|nr:thioredoxin-disulfide reductase [Clostridia bacterium]